MPYTLIMLNMTAHITSSYFSLQSYKQQHLGAFRQITCSLCVDKLIYLNYILLVRCMWYLYNNQLIIRGGGYFNQTQIIFFSLIINIFVRCDVTPPPRKKNYLAFYNALIAQNPWQINRIASNWSPQICFASLYCIMHTHSMEPTP